MNPIVYTTRSFLIEFSKAISKEFSDIPREQKYLLLFLEELIYRRSAIFLDHNDEFINKIGALSLEEIFKDPTIEEEEDKIFYSELKKLLISGRKVESCSSNLRLIRSEDYQGYSNATNKPDFLLLGESKSICKTIQDKIGVICISKDLICDTEGSYKMIEKDFPAFKEYQLSEKLIGIPQANTFILEDPYFFTQDFNFIHDLFTTLVPNILKVKPCKFLIVTKDGNGNPSLLKKLQKEFKGQIDLTIIYERQFHDRNLYSNSYWISSGYGFMKKYSAPTKWVSYPIGLHYKEYKTKLVKYT